MAMASTGSSSSVDENFVEEVTQGTSMTTREELADDDIQDDDGSSCYQVPDFFRIMSKAISETFMNASLPITNVSKNNKMFFCTSRYVVKFKHAHYSFKILNFGVGDHLQMFSIIFSRRTLQIQPEIPWPRE